MNKRKISSIFWGVVFILAGGTLLADRLGWIDFSSLSISAWTFIFAGLSLLFLLSYLLNGLQEWGWLFPTFIFAALAVTVWMAENETTGSFIGSPILFAVALPFFIGYFFNRKSWGLLIPAWILSFFAIMTALADVIEGTFIGAMFLFAVAIPFLVVYLLDRSRWWALIPAWITFILGIVTLLSNHVNGNIIGALFLYAVALPFLVLFFTNRTRKWALIPAIVLAVVGTIPLLSSFVGGDWMGPVVMFLFAAAFIFVYLRWKDAWWALIPTGIFASIGVVALLGLFVPPNQELYENLLSGVLFLGFGTTFGVLWLLRAKWPTEWSKYPAIVLFCMAVLAVIFGTGANLFLPVLLLAGGITLVAFTFLRKDTNNQPK